MKRIILKTLMLVPSVFAFQVMAQSETSRIETSHENQVQEITIDNLWGPYESSRCSENWFFSLDCGMNSYFGGNHAKADLEDRLWPMGHFSVGKFITPVVGLRLQMGYGYLKGWGYADEGYINKSEGPDEKGLYEKNYNVFTWHGDFLWNVSSQIYGYNKNRVYELIAVAGGGLCSSSCHTHELTVVFGLLNRFRLNKALDFNIEVKTNLVDSDFDRNTRPNEIEQFAGVQLGFTYHIAPRGFKRVRPDRVRTITEIVNTREITDQTVHPVGYIKEETNEIKPSVFERVTTDTITRTIERYNYIVPELSVFFELNSAELSSQDKVNLQKYAAAIKESGENEYVVIGYADLQTGSSDYNERLAVKRAESVLHYLVDELSLPVNRVVREKADLKNPPYSKYTDNRTVVLRTRK